jgi:hypothetical protein
MGCGGKQPGSGEGFQQPDFSMLQGLPLVLAHKATMGKKWRSMSRSKYYICLFFT